MIVLKSGARNASDQMTERLVGVYTASSSARAPTSQPVMSELSPDSVRLTTVRLVLREIEQSDADSLYSYWSDPEVTRYMPRRVVSRKGVGDLVKKALEGRYAKPRRYFRLAVTLKELGALVGDCVCRVTDQESKEDLAKIIGQAYIGYFLNRKSWGKGYATEVGRALLSFGFEQLKLLRIWAWCDTENSASVRVLEKLDMRQEAHFRKSVMVQGNWRDCFVYGILRDEWDPSAKFHQSCLGNEPRYHRSQKQRPPLIPC